SRWGCGPRHTATTGAGPTSTHSGPGAILPTCGLAQPLEYLLSSLSAQQDLDDCAIGLATIDLSASAPLCQSPVFRFSTTTKPRASSSSKSGIQSRPWTPLPPSSPRTLSASRLGLRDRPCTRQSDARAADRCQAVPLPSALARQYRSSPR